MLVKYIATVEGVRDITLIGTADYDYWTDQLEHEHLIPFKRNGCAEVWICAARLRWKGVRFSELSVSLRVGIEGDDVLLISAFNTSRLFTWFERRCFHTPYRRAVMDVDATSLRSFALHDGKDVSIRAERLSGPPVETRNDAWEGRIYLPSIGRAKSGQRFFRASLSGTSSITPFQAATDSLVLHATPSHSIASQLIDSHFRGIEWRVRNDATHARSKTFIAS